MTRERLLASGVPAGTIGTWVRRGRLHRVLPGIYAVPPVDPLTRVAAALLWLPVGVASHRTAAWLWQLAEAPAAVELTVPRASSRRSPVPWLRLYRRDLASDRVVLWDNLPTVEPEQTVLDCLGILGGPAGALLIDTALAGRAHPAVLRDRCLGNVGRRGAKVAVRALTLAVPGAASHPERVLARALRRAGIGGFLVNSPVRGYVADLLDERLRLIIEVDGWSTHGHRNAFQRDRARQNLLVAAGYTVLRYTAEDVARRLPDVLAQVRDVVERLSAETSLG